MKPIKVTNERTGGNLFHYAHFICDCVYPDFISEVFSYSDVFREKTIDQTLGNFSSLYEEIFGCKHHELPTDEFKSLECEHIASRREAQEDDAENFSLFRNFIFNRLNIQELNIELDKLYASCPEVILIKRGDPVELISDEELNNQNPNKTNGKERREIRGIDKVEEKLQKQYGKNFRAVSLEEVPFRNQVHLFNNAKLIICAHGACMSNLFFCNEGTKVVEVQAQTAYDQTIGAGKYKFFDYISKILNLDHYKLKHNNPFSVIKKVKEIY